MTRKTIEEEGQQQWGGRKKAERKDEGEKAED